MYSFAPQHTQGHQCIPDKILSKEGITEIKRFDGGGISWLIRNNQIRYELTASFENSQPAQSESQIYKWQGAVLYDRTYHVASNDDGISVPTA